MGEYYDDKINHGDLVEVPYLHEDAF